MLTPDLDTYLKMAAEGRPVVVSRTILADLETPLSAYWKLAHDSETSFLLESVTGGEQLARYSIVGDRPGGFLRVKSGEAVLRSQGEIKAWKLEPGQDPLHALADVMPKKAPLQTHDLPPFVGGAVGMVGYEFIRYLERIGEPLPDPLQVPELAMLLADGALVFDHAKNLIHILALADGTQESYEAAAQKIQGQIERLRKPLPELPSGKFPVHPVVGSVSQERFEEMVATAVEYIGAGDGQQVVPSLRFSARVDAHPLTVYRALRSINPSPYMFLIRFGDFDLVGASPELHVSLHGSKARVRPIAGTRWRGETREDDDRLATELLADEKERAEHIMLVDLGRNDLGRVSNFGSVQVRELMTIERYSHVMHIVSDVVSELSPTKDAFDLIRATFPAGTVSGSPKVRAMQIINELEPSQRGSYAGAVGLIAASGETDLCIALRTLLIKDGFAHAQAGGGVVFDSEPGYEYREAVNKAKAGLRAIEMAQLGLDD